VRDSAGGEVREITKLTHDTHSSSDAHYYPNLAQLSNNRAFLSWTRGGDYGDIYYAVLDSSGNMAKNIINLSRDGTTQWDWSSDAAHLFDGKTVVAWTSDSSSGYNIRFAVLDAHYNLVTGPAILENPAGITGNAYVSVAPSGNNAILTWMDYSSGYRRNLYYALVNSDGAKITPPQIFLTSQAISPYIETSYYGQGNTSNRAFQAPLAYLPMIQRSTWLAPHPRELPAHDDGGREAWAGGTQGRVMAVHYPLSPTARVHSARFYLGGEMRPMRLIVWNGAWQELYSQTLTPNAPSGGGWWTWTLPTEVMGPQSEVYVGYQCLSDYVSSGPWVGLDTSQPKGETYAGPWPPMQRTDGNAMIRVTVK
jgi:hypothetical protein